MSFVVTNDAHPRAFFLIGDPLILSGPVGWIRQKVMFDEKRRVVQGSESVSLETDRWRVGCKSRSATDPIGRFKLWRVFVTEEIVFALHTRVLGDQLRIECILVGLVLRGSDRRIRMTRTEFR
jgi:hypothetical protein